MAIKDTAQAEKELMNLIKKKMSFEETKIVGGLYRFMAKVDAIELSLLKKKIITRKMISREMKSIYEYMKKDFE